MIPPDTSGSGFGTSTTTPRGTRWLSRDLHDLLAQQASASTCYDLVVVGSGYGGAMAVAQLTQTMDLAAGARPKVCLLERGQEYLPGSFGSRTADLPPQVRASGAKGGGFAGTPSGLFDFKPGPDVCALVASGLGGGSLINAAVMLEPDDSQLDNAFPSRVRRALRRGHLRAAKRILGATRAGQDNTVGLSENLPAGGLAKTRLLQSLAPASQGEATFKPAALTIEMQGASNPFGVPLHACTLCGDCATGCNVGARESLDTNLLVAARAAGAEIYTGASVLQIGRAIPPAGGEFEWVLEVVHTDPAQQERCGPPLTLRAKNVILAAGSFGSTEILLRSKHNGLPLSDCLGSRFSCNGDNLLAMYKARLPAHAVAAQTQPLQPPGRQVGPTITGMLQFKPSAIRRGFYVQDFSVPAPLRQLLEHSLASLHLLQRLSDWSRAGASDGSARDPLAADPQALEHSLVLGVIGHDHANGRLTLAASARHAGAEALGMAQAYRTERITVQWPQARYDPQQDQAFTDIQRLVKPHLLPGGELLPNPLTQPLPEGLRDLVDNARGPVVTVHPLGGCPMGSSEASGVVDEYGVVFKAQARPGQQASGAPDDWQGSLLVVDGSIVPGSLGANPALTIAALGLRAARHCQLRWQWQYSDTTDVPLWVKNNPRPHARLPAECTEPAQAATKVQLVERLHGAIGNGLYAELTFGFEPVTVQQLTQPPCTLRTDAALPSTMPGTNHLRIFAQSKWQDLHLNCADDAVREQHALIVARLAGTLDYLHRKPACLPLKTARGLFAYMANRGLRDALRSFKETQDTQLAAPQSPWWRTVLRLASHAGEVRTLRYCMTVTSVDRAQPGWTGKLKPGDSVQGIKRFTYAWRSNPWNQLLWLRLVKMPLADLCGSKPQLKLDARFLANQAMALVRITQQHNQVTALADLAGLAVFGARLFLSTHLLSFRRPDAPSGQRPYRLPGAVSGLPAPQIQELVLQHHTNAQITQPVQVRLTRYANPRTDKPPLVLLHGFSASGTTYTHPSLSPGMAGYFWQRGYDVWVVDLRTSPDLPTATHCWSFEDVAWADIPVAITHVADTVQRERNASPPVQVDVFAHCVSALMLSTALLTDPQLGGFKAYARSLHQCTALDGEGQLIYAKLLQALPARIGRVVLSQKSFALDYSDANVLRAYLMRWMRYGLSSSRYVFRPASPLRLHDKLADMFLAALPYPHEEYDRENPPPWRFWQRTPWTTSRHRMDALYEHTFNPNNLDDAVLASIDDFFGPINIDTVAQILHIARHKAITTTEGKNLFVTADNLQARWPKGGTLGLHNADNKMVDGSTLQLTAQWMAGAGIPYTPCSLPGMAHQDGLIGKRREVTFAKVLEFLEAPVVPALPAANVAIPMALQLPWIGPRIHCPPGGFSRGHVQIRVGASPGMAQARVVVLPVCRQLGTLTLAGVLPPGALPSLLISATSSSLPPAYFFLDLPKPPPAMADVAHLIPKMLSLQGLAPPAEVDGVVVLLYSSHSQDSTAHGADIARLYEALSAAERIAAFVPRQSYEPLPQSPAAVPARFAIGSCKYPAGVFDGGPAAWALEQMFTLQQNGRLQALLLLGDQIYADASAGLLDPSREDDRFQRPYEDLFRIPAMRAILRTTPTQMMLDDHEIVDNWEPGPSRKNAEWFRQGLNAYWRYQRLEDSKPDGTPLDVASHICGFPLYMADTRTERELRNAQLPHAHIMQMRQSDAIQAWLLALNRDPATRSQPKFVSCSAMLLPRPIGMQARTSDRLHFDSWVGYPDSIEELLGFIAANNIRGVVLLGGDEHLGNATEVHLRDGNGMLRSRVLSIHAPALYAPFPFANSRATDFATQESFGIFYGSNQFTCEVHARFTPERSGFAALALAPGLNGWQLEVNFHCQGARHLKTIFII